MGGHQPSLRTTLWSLCGNALWRIIASQLRNSAVISRRFTAPWCTKLSRITCCPENCAPGGCQSNWHQNKKQSVWSQHWHFWSSTRMTSFWTGSSQVMHTLPQKPSVAVDLPARRNSRGLRQRGKWCARCSGTDGAFSSSISRPVVRWMQSVTEKQCRNSDGSFITNGAGCLVPVLTCCTITVGNTRLSGQHLLQEFIWEVFNHPPYNSDLAPSAFHLFLHLKKFLSGQRFQNEREAEMSITQWFQSQAADFYDTGIQMLVPRYDKCLNSRGEYVEK